MGPFVRRCAIFFPECSARTRKRTTQFRRSGTFWHTHTLTGLKAGVNVDTCRMRAGGANCGPSNQGRAATIDAPIPRASCERELGQTNAHTPTMRFGGFFSGHLTHTHDTCGLDAQSFAAAGTQGMRKEPFARRRHDAHCTHNLWCFTASLILCEVVHAQKRMHARCENWATFFLVHTISRTSPAPQIHAQNVMYQVH